VVKGTPNDRTYTWGPVPFHDPLKLSDSCKIRVRDSAHPSTVLDESDGVFSIEAAAAPMTLGPLEAMNDFLANDPDGVEKDSDGDGLYDNVEIYLGTDPLNWDSDLDGFEDYWEVFGDVSHVPVPDGDDDGTIAALDNDDDDDGLNDGRSLDSDGDGIPDYLETYGFVYHSGAPLKYYLWDGDIGDDYYKTNPSQASTDQDQYSDSLEVTKINMDLTVASPGDNPMMAAFPNFVVKLTGYDVQLNSTITETDGTVHTNTSTWNHTTETSTSVTDEWHWEVGAEVGVSMKSFTGSVNASYGQSHSKTYTESEAVSHGGEMSQAVEWSRATSTNYSEAARIELDLEVQNVGTCVAENVRITLNLKIGGKDIATLIHPPAPGTISRLIVGESYPWVSEQVMLTLDELRALRTGAPVTIKITSVKADVVRREGDTYVYVNDWGLYFTAAENASAHLFLDLGDGHTTEHLVYAGEADWEPVVTLRDALIWAANAYETSEGPYVRFYQPGGSLGAPAPLDEWYFSMDQITYDRISSYMQSPGFNFFDTVLTPESVIVAKAPPIHDTPKIHWAVLSPRDGKVTAYVDDYFFNQSRLTVHFVDKNGSWHRMTWDELKLQFSWDCPYDYFIECNERIVAKNPMYNNPDDPNSWKYKTVMRASEMVIVPAVIIDQEQWTSNGIHSFSIAEEPSEPKIFDQAVTAGVTGQLTNIEFEADIVNPWVVFYVDTTPHGAGHYTSMAFWTKLDQGGPGYDTYNIDVSAANIWLNSGDAFSIGLWAEEAFGDLGGFRAGIDNNPYSGGALYWRYDATGWLGLGYDDDMMFRTYINPEFMPDTCTGVTTSTVGWD